MRHPALFAYQLVIGASDTVTGAFLCVVPVWTMGMMGLHVDPRTEPYLAYIGTFVFSVGLSCLYGAWLFATDAPCARTEVVWLLTAFTRSAVAIYVLKAILAGSLEPGWASVAVFDGACAIVQGVGLRRRWLADA